MVIKIHNNFYFYFVLFFFSSRLLLHRFQLQKVFFSLSIHTWHLNSLNVISPLLVIKIQFFFSSWLLLHRIQFNQLYKIFFFSLYIHVTPQLPQRLFLYSSMSPLFSLLNPTSGPDFCFHCLSLYVLLSLSLSLCIVLSSSLYTHTSHFLSLKRFLSLTTNLQ